MLLLAALIPPIALIIFIWRVDPVEKESPRLVLRVFIYGAISGLVAGTVEAFLSVPITYAFGEGTLGYLLVENFIGVALIEEAVKMAVVARFIWRHYEFDHTFDGIVYAVASALGFAALENVGYVFAFGGLPVAIVRAITAIPGHAIFGVFMGALISAAKLAQVKGDKSRSSLLLLAALLVPMLIHGAYDFLATLQSDASTTAFFVYLIAMYIAGFIIVKREAKHDRPFDPDVVARRRQLEAQAQAQAQRFAQGYGYPQGQGYPQPYTQGQGQVAQNTWGGVPLDQLPQMPAEGQKFSDLENPSAEELAHRYED